jgi:hypothetical protein
LLRSTFLEFLGDRIVLAAAGDLDEGFIKELLDKVRPAQGRPVIPQPEDPLGIFLRVAQKSITDVDTNNRVVRFVPFLRGIFIQNRFRDYVRRLGPEFAAEESYASGVRVRYGEKGSVRADAIFGPLNNPIFAVELKTGGAFLTQAEKDNYNANLPIGTELVEIRESTLTSPRSR